MKEMYFTIAGTSHYYGQEFLEPKMGVTLVKEPDNEYDKEAIKVMMLGLNGNTYWTKYGYREKIYLKKTSGGGLDVQGNEPEI